MSCNHLPQEWAARPDQVLVALVGDRVYVFTDIESGKVKRIGNGSRVMLALATSRAAEPTRR
jgi:hypothetical protein